ncbi:unnamed protein product [marine sediment metagenome]|uniref:HTH cro/C1-type domain-containing protein n=1 Tax=marine sediment metagenome TaxID=412755 RepID=X1JPT6_9ZZZZ
MRFGAKLKAIRAWREMSQHDLADRVGVPAPLISRIETGLILPNADLEERITEALDWQEALLEMQETPG